MSHRLLNCFWAAFLSDCYSLLPYFLYSFGLPFGVTAVVRAVPVRSGGAGWLGAGCLGAGAGGWGWCWAGGPALAHTPPRQQPRAAQAALRAPLSKSLTSPKVKRS